MTHGVTFVTGPGGSREARWGQYRMILAEVNITSYTVGGEVLTASDFGMQRLFGMWAVGQENEEYHYTVELDTSGDPAAGGATMHLRAEESARMAGGGVLVNQADHALGDTTITVDTVDATTIYSVGDIVYTATGVRVGVISAVAATTITIATGCEVALANNAALWIGRGGWDEVATTTDVGVVRLMVVGV